MIEFDKFITDLCVLNRRNTTERSLEKYLIACQLRIIPIDSRHTSTTELLKRYMAAVRSRNKVRRNWHPDRAHDCDLQTLDWISKEDFKKAATTHLRDALSATTGGSKSIQENCIDDLANKLADDFFSRKRKRNKPTTFQSVVREIRKLSWVKTTSDVIHEMRSNPREYGIVKIDDTYVEIEVSLGVGKDTKIIRRALDSIKNIK
jgi:hypothetical protein